MKDTQEIMLSRLSRGRLSKASKDGKNSHVVAK